MGTKTKVVRAIIESNKDPKNLGRVQVKYPWLGDSNIISDWARVVQASASKNSGMWFPSQVGDEVLALIEDDDLSTPVILGHFYSEKNKAPVSKLGNKPNVKYFQTSSGSVIAMDEEKDIVLIETGAGAALKIEKDKIAIGSNGTEVLDLNVQLMEAMIQAASTFCHTSVGPGVLNPEVQSKLNELKTKLTQIKGKL